MATLSASRLIRALQCGEIVPYFQPQIELRTGILAGFEVLARWLHPELGVLPPCKFIPMAEDANLLSDVTEEVLGQASVAVAAFCPKHLRLSVNISAHQLVDPELCERLSLIAECSGFPLSCLTLELTESRCVENVVQARAMVREMHSCGLRLSLDDFGKGYASLHHLHEIPFDELKIDKSFVQCISEYQRSEDFVAGVIAVGKNLGISTVAEGIETHIQADLLASLQCELGQGFLFGAPVPAYALPSLLMKMDAGEYRKLCCVNGGTYPVATPESGRLDCARSPSSTSDPYPSHVLLRQLNYARHKHSIKSLTMNTQLPIDPFSPRKSSVSHPPVQKKRVKISSSYPSAAATSKHQREEDMLQDLSSKLLKAQEEERRRIARELHDSVLQAHALISLNLDRVTSTALSRASRDALEDAKALIAHCSEELRTICYLLHPPLIEDLGLESALRIYVEGLIRRTEIDIQIQILTPLPRFESNFELALFRVVQESLSNILRHSGSTWARIGIHLAEDLVLEVEDRGKGLPASFFPPTQPHAHVGVGIAGMMERVRPFGGTIELLSTNPGLLVRATVPKLGRAR
jgi:EAL domain-containing protein (putative c-di-GMP-specific phosphodiesterase class I)